MSLKVIPLLQAFSSAIFRLYGASCSPSSSAELLVYGNVEDVAVCRFLVISLASVFFLFNKQVETFIQELEPQINH